MKELVRFVVLGAVASLFLWLFGILLCAFLAWLARRVVRWASPVAGRWVHADPWLHRARWSDKIAVRHVGPFREYPLFGRKYYASAEGRKCKECGAFLIVRLIRLD